ncbi:MAG TPA: response regulator [Longilinea sp.]|nr:response regulator [Longilinea sp.]
MGKARLLLVEDDTDISNMLKIYFSTQGYDVDTVTRGSEAVEKTRHVMPHLIVLDIMLPDIDGYEVCQILRQNTRTSHIPVIFLTQKDERGDKLQGLELGADDYITKPFDIEELKLRVQNAITRSERESLTDPLTGLPAGRIIEDQLRKIIRIKDWALMDIRINSYEVFKEVYGFIAANEVLRFTAGLLGEIVDQAGSSNDFIGHTGGDNFIVITSLSVAQALRQQIRKQFESQVQTHYNFIDRDQGYVLTKDDNGNQIKAELMTLAVGVVSPETHEFSDIREITELAAEARRMESSKN